MNTNKNNDDGDEEKQNQMQNLIDNDDLFKKEIDLKLMEIEKLKNCESK